MRMIGQMADDRAAKFTRLAPSPKRLWRPGGRFQRENEPETDEGGDDANPEGKPVAGSDIKDAACEYGADETSHRAREHGHPEKQAV